MLEDLPHRITISLDCLKVHYVDTDFQTVERLTPILRCVIPVVFRSIIKSCSVYIADTKLLTNFNHSKPTIAFNKVTNRCDVLWGVLVLGRRWWLVFCTASLPPRHSLCQNFTCVIDSVDSPYCARNLRQISLGPKFSLVRNFITTRCAIVIGTSLSLILNSSNWGEGESGGEVRRVPNPHHSTAQGHYPIVLIRWLQQTEVGLYLICRKKICIK